MDYSEITRRVRKLDFIGNDQAANAAVKTVLDGLACRLNDEQAHTLADKFPGHVDLEKCGSESKKIETLSVADYIAGISTQFKISVYQAVRSYAMFCISQKKRSEPMSYWISGVCRLTGLKQSRTRKRVARSRTGSQRGASRFEDTKDQVCFI